MIGERSYCLERIYKCLNRRYFNNRLPKDVPVFIANLGKEDGYRRLGKIVYDMEMQRVSDKRKYQLKTVPFTIVVAHNLYLNELKFTMFHEMNHVYLSITGHSGVRHGPLFQKGMLRLAKAGAFKGIW
jgi:hypothetical protein